MKADDGMTATPVQAMLCRACFVVAAMWTPEAGQTARATLDRSASSVEPWESQSRFGIIVSGSLIALPMR
jgi:hypothetical protein